MTQPPVPNEGAPSPAESARAILRTMVALGTQANEIAILGPVNTAFVEAGGRAEQFAEGIEHAAQQGWLVIDESRITLTEPGFEQSKL
jgi:hypothetical protein